MNNLNLGNTNSIEKQQCENKKREEYYWSKNSVQSNAAKENITTEKGQWPKNTKLIVGDSIINSVSEEGLCRGGRNVKVRNFSGVSVDYLNHHIILLLQKKPRHIIVYTGTNDTYHSTSREILNKLLNFKSLIQENLPDCKVFISTPTLPSDNGKATLLVNQLTNHPLQLNIDIADNRNIISKHLSRKGLHLPESGSHRLAINVLEHLKKFWKNERYASIVEEDELAICNKTANLSNNHIESEKEKKKSQNLNVKSLREENSDRPIFVQININSIRNKFQFLASQVISNVDVLLVSETKLDDYFPAAQFLLNGLSKSCRLDRCSNGGRLLLYIKDDISSRLLTDERKSTKPQ